MKRSYCLFNFLSPVMARTPKRSLNLLPEAFDPGDLRHGIGGRVYVRGHLCFSQHHRHVGNVILEAHASGLPVVVSDSGGPKELVADKANGLITRSHDVEDFTRAIRALVTNRALRERMANSARESVTDRSWPRAFAKFWASTEL